MSDSPVTFELISTDLRTGARRGRLHTPHGTIETPCFMCVGTQATVKAMTPRDLKEVGAGIVLANTYHLHLRPGHDLVREMGGLHDFSRWYGPMLEGVEFRSHIDGHKMFFTPEYVMEIEQALGADIAMAFDECAPADCDRNYAIAAMKRTHRWAQRCKDAHTREDQALFGIVQGGVFADLRIESAKTLADMDFPGYGIGGISVGEPKPVMYDMLEQLMPHMPVNKPHYLMGVGSPDCLVEGSMRGVDMFDCVLQTRSARNGLAFTFEGKKMLRNAQFAHDDRPIEDDCDCYCCRNFSRAYLRHLIKAGEILAAQLITMHNLRFTYRLMEGVRKAIEENRLTEYRNELLLRGTFE